MLKKHFVLVLASLRIFILGAACLSAMGQQTFATFVRGTTPESQLGHPMFMAGDGYILNVQAPQPNTAFSLCKIPPNSTTPSCAAYGTTDSYGNWNPTLQQTGTFSSNDIGTWTWYATISVNGVVSQSLDTVFAVLSPSGDTAGNPPPPPPAQVLIAKDGFPSDTLASLQAWMNWLNQAYVAANVFYPVILSRGVNISPSATDYYYTGSPDQIWFQTKIVSSKTSENGDYWALCREIGHTRNFPYLFASRMEESWVTAECREVYRTIAKDFPAAFGVSPLPTFITDGRMFDTGDRKTVVYGGAGQESWNVNTQGADQDGSALLDILSERLISLQEMQKAINLGKFAPAGDQAANFDGLAESLGVTNVEGVRPSVLFNRNSVNFGLAPNGVTYLGVQECGLSSFGVFDAGSGFCIDLVQYQNDAPVYQAGTIDWNISDASDKIVTSGTITATGSHVFLRLALTSLYQNGKLTLSEGAYHFSATVRDASGHPSSDPNLFSEDVFAVIDPSRILGPGDLVVVANGENGKFGNLGSCNDLTLVSPQGASISGSGSLCFVTNVPKTATGKFEDVTLRGYGFTTTFVPSSTSASKRNFKHLDQPALVQGATDITGKTATALVSGETLILKGWGFTANDASTAMSVHPSHNTPRRAMAATPTASVTLAAAPVASPRPPRRGPSPPTSGCKGTELSDQGRSEVWFTQNGTTLKAEILFCADNQMEVFVPAGLTPGADVAISVVVNGTQGVNALTLPVTK